MSPAPVLSSVSPSKLVTGHTASDVAETLLFNLVRGSGSDGLQALGWQRPLSPSIMLVRPLLCMTRQETASFCSTHQLPLWLDSTNSDLRFARNRIRHEVMPYLKAHLNCKAEQHLTQTAELFREDVDFLESESEKLLLQAVSGIPNTAAYLNSFSSQKQDHHQACSDVWGSRIQNGSEATPLSINTRVCALNRNVLLQGHSAIRRRAVRKLLKTLFKRQCTFDNVQDILALLNAPNRSQSNMIQDGYLAYVDSPWIRFRRCSSHNSGDFSDSNQLHQPTNHSRLSPTWSCF